MYSSSSFRQPLPSWSVFSGSVNFSSLVSFRLVRGRCHFCGELILSVCFWFWFLFWFLFFFFLVHLTQKADALVLRSPRRSLWRGLCLVLPLMIPGIIISISSNDDLVRVCFLFLPFAVISLFCFLFHILSLSF